MRRLAQGHHDTRSDRTSNLAVTSQPALPLYLLSIHVKPKSVVDLEIEVYGCRVSVVENQQDDLIIGSIKIL